MERFKELPKEKQLPMIDAALKCFGKYGYKKASMKDIAQNSGVSKPMLFHYFGTKKELYRFLTEYARNVMLDGYKRDEIDSYDDFFERLIVASEMKMGILEKYPHLSQFIVSMFKETDSEVAEITNLMMPDAQKFSYNLVVKDGDMKKFKKGVDINMLMRLIFLMAEGYAYEVSGGNSDFSNVSEELKNMMRMLKNNLYREEYL
ncbi:MAG: TetR/AcrR family transcriptional regulator [Ruminococcaceae bacterium]|nr:TetR/AcrR family transcriptional regulator [Oscillospiraceae bacterium]